jgi:mono/diheme cytochrome c family protein
MKRFALMTLSMSALVGSAMPAVAAEIAGGEVFTHYCSYCHGTEEGPGTQQLRRTRGADKALLARRTDLAPVYIEYVVRHGLKSMPPFVPSDLTDAKLKALAGFLTSPLPRP